MEGLVADDRRQIAWTVLLVLVGTIEGGFADAHLSLTQAGRVTHPPVLILDLVLLHGPTPSDPSVCPGAVCDALSDHRAVWVDVTLP
jgi:hypothetical protein